MHRRLDIVAVTISSVDTLYRFQLSQTLELIRWGQANFSKEFILFPADLDLCSEKRTIWSPMIPKPRTSACVDLAALLRERGAASISDRRVKNPSHRIPKWSPACPVLSDDR